MKWLVIVVLASGCLAIGSKEKPTTGQQIFAGVVGATATAAAFTAAAYAHDAPITTQGGVAVATSAVPMAAIFLGDEPEDPTTEGEIYSRLTSGLVSALGASLSFAAPLIGTKVAGEEVEHDTRATYTTMGGILLGSVISVALAKRLPKWGRVVVGAAVTGSFATLGYQLGGGGPL